MRILIQRLRKYRPSLLYLELSIVLFGGVKKGMGLDSFCREVRIRGSALWHSVLGDTKHRVTSEILCFE